MVKISPRPKTAWPRWDASAIGGPWECNVVKVKQSCRRRLPRPPVHRIASRRPKPWPGERAPIIGDDAPEIRDGYDRVERYVAQPRENMNLFPTARR
jgi:hypothetical protein